MSNYRIIGADQKEYGPVDSDQMRAWIAQRRVNATTRVRSDEGGDWKTLADFPEFSRDFRASSPPLPASQTAPDAKTSGMAITSLVLGILGLLTCGLSALPGVVLGLVSMRGIQKSKGQLKGSGIALAGTIVSGCFLFLLPVFAAMLLPAIATAKGRAQTIQCVYNLKQLALASRMYSENNKNQFPPANTWCDAIKNETHMEKVFQCPVAKNGERSHYAFNSKLDGMEVGQAAPDTVMLFETDGGWNVSGGPELMIHSPRHARKYVVAFVDGSVQQITEAQRGTLRWDPTRSE